ncbi:MAG: hypothetical protein Kow00128_18030 [Deltaproteobacteria bacterium]
MKRKRSAGGKSESGTPGKRRRSLREEPPRERGAAQDPLAERAMRGDEEAFLDLVRFHSTFNPLPLTPELLQASGIDEVTRARLSERLQRKEDRLLRPFPGIDMVFWGEEWVQETLHRFLWRRRGGRTVPNGAFLKRLWDASREGAALQLRIYRKAAVTPGAWVRVKAPHFTNLGLTDAQMLKVARAEGCRFEEKAFLSAVKRFRKTIP